MMNRSNIKVITFLLLLFSITSAQDIIKSISGKEASGRLVEITDEHIVFILQGSSNVTKIPKNSIKSVMSDDGVIKYSLDSLMKKNLSNSSKDSKQSIVPLYNPCENKRYLTIKSKSLDDMSQREYDYFNQKDAECSDYNNRKK